MRASSRRIPAIYIDPMAEHRRPERTWNAAVATGAHRRRTRRCENRAAERPQAAFSSTHTHPTSVSTTRVERRWNSGAGTGSPDACAGARPDRPCPAVPAAELRLVGEDGDLTLEQHRGSRRRRLLEERGSATARGFLPCRHKGGRRCPPATSRPTLGACGARCLHGRGERGTPAAREIDFWGSGADRRGRRGVATCGGSSAARRASR